MDTDARSMRTAWLSTIHEDTGGPSSYVQSCYLGAAVGVFGALCCYLDRYGFTASVSDAHHSRYCLGCGEYRIWIHLRRWMLVHPERALLVRFEG
jgi:hypothetical protein